MENGWKKISVIILMGLVVWGIGHSAINAAELKKAIIIVDPGITNYSLKIAKNIAAEMKYKDINVELLTTREIKKQSLAGYNYLILGGPTYFLQPTKELQNVFDKISDGTGIKTLLFMTAGGNFGNNFSILTKLAKNKGLQVIACCGFTVGEQSNQKTIAAKIDKLLASL